MAIPDFIAGLVYGLTRDNHLEEIELCYQDGGVIDHYFKTGMEDLHHGGADWETQGIINFGIAALNIPVMLKGCAGMGDDLKAIEDWASIFLHPTRLIEDVGKHMLLHRKKIESDIGLLKTDIASHMWFESGEVAADLLTLAIGPIDVPPTMVAPSNEMPGFAAKSVPDFVAGLLYGWTGDNHLYEIEACYHSDLPILQDLHLAADSLFNGRIIKSLEQFEKAVYGLQVAMEPCHAMQDDIAALAAWAAVFKEPAHLVEVVGVHWELHKRGIKRDIATTKADWAMGEYFKAGEATADAFTLLIGQVE